jgi:hypothetical protein
MFQDLDFHQIFRDYGHMSTEALGSYIVEHMAAMPRKRKVDAANPQPIQSPSKASQRRGKVP